MSMEDLWPRQSVHGWVLFLGIKSVYNDFLKLINNSSSSNKGNQNREGGLETRS